MTDEEVRTAIKDIIAAASPTSVVWPYNTLSHDIRQWPAPFKNDSGITDGWMIMRTAIDAHWKNATREKATWKYTILGFYDFAQGNQTSNSDYEFGVKIDAIREGFRAKPTLEIQCVEKHDLLQVLTNTTLNCGEDVVHVAQCKLDVHVCY